MSERISPRFFSLRGAACHGQGPASRSRSGMGPLSAVLLVAVYGCSSGGSSFGTGGAPGSSGTGGSTLGTGGSVTGTGGSTGTGSGGTDPGPGTGGANVQGTGGEGTLATGGTGTASGGSGPGTGGSGPGSGGAVGTGGRAAGGATGTGGSVASACPKPAGQICHEFIASDNGRNQTNYVNEFDPSKNWTTKVGESGENSPRAIQIVDNMMAKSGKAVLISTNSGYSELDLVDGKSLKKVPVGSGVTWALRLPDGSGNTAVAKDPSILIYGPTGVSTGKTITLPSGPADTLRAINYDPTTKHYFFSKGERPGHVYEITDTGSIVWDTSLGSISKGYLQYPREGGGVFATTGYLTSVVEIDAAKTVKILVDGKKFPEYKVDFFSGFFRLPNGNLMVASWLGHVGNPDPKTPQALEFSADGTKVVWTWGIQTQAQLVTNVYVIR